jgi:Tfp pilus assembly protein PilX
VSTNIFIYFVPAKSNKRGIIAGVSIAVLVVLALIMFGAYQLIRRSKNSTQDSGPEEEKQEGL